jgi:hypothetical protein
MVTTRFSMTQGGNRCKSLVFRRLLVLVTRLPRSQKTLRNSSSMYFLSFLLFQFASMAYFLLPSGNRVTDCLNSKYVNDLRGHMPLANE